MIIEFSVANFRSIKELQTISFVAAPIVSKYKEMDENNTFQATDKLRLLKSLAVYGANASGKSNFVKAISAFNSIVHLSVSEPDTIAVMIQPFLLSYKTESSPSFFQLIFILNGITYRYGFEATRKEITSEWLFANSNKANSKEVYIFKREFQGLTINEKQYKSIAKFKKFLTVDNPIFKSNSLLITALSALNETISSLVKNYIINNFFTTSGLGDKNIRNFVDDAIANDAEFRKEILKILKESDTNIQDIQSLHHSELNIENQDAEFFKNTIQGSKQRLIVTFHKKQDTEEQKNVPFLLDFHDSEGTRKMYEIYPIVYLTLKNGMSITIDEFDARFHPRLSQKIIDLFNNPKTNPKNAQLLVVTHDTNLLSAKTFRRDQILFVEKDKNEASRLYSLAEFKGVRNDASFEKDYLDGRYGAVPILNNFSTIFEN